MSALTEPIVIGPGMAGTLMTPEEFDAAQDWEEGYVYELINEVLVVSPPAGIEERGPNDLLAQLLRNYRDQHPQGKALDYTVSEHTIRTGRNRRRADRVIWAGLGRLPDPDREPPTIAIEFLSPGRRSRTRDYEVKRKEYDKAGITEYWLIDRFRQKLTVFRRKARKAPLVLGADETYTTPLLPGFELPLARIFTEAELFHEQAEDDQ
jgi:Uma2 family endonuclease